VPGYVGRAGKGVGSNIKANADNLKSMHSVYRPIESGLPALQKPTSAGLQAKRQENNVKVQVLANVQCKQCKQYSTSISLD
jgi:hypothetical protein